MIIFNDIEQPPYPGFKVMPFFDAEYLRNGTRYIVSMEY